MELEKIADSTSLIGRIRIGRGIYFAQGTVIRSMDNSVEIKSKSYILENSVVVGTKEFPVSVGAKTVFGHKSIVIGAKVGDLCEIGNNTILMEGSSLGDMCILGEGTLIPKGIHIPNRSVVVGRPGRVIRTLTEQDLDMIRKMRGNNLNIDPYEEQHIEKFLKEESEMGKLYVYQNKYPQIKQSTLVLQSAEITGDVVIGENTIIGAGVKIVGDAHGPIRIGNNVQILENTVLHLLPDNELVIEDDVIIGPGCMLHGCRIGAGTVIEPGVIVCDYSTIGKNSLIKAGTLVKQRSQFPDQVILEGFSAKVVERIDGSVEAPAWGFIYEDVEKLIFGEKNW